MQNPHYLLRPMGRHDLKAVAEISALGAYSDWTEGSFESCFKENYHGWVLTNQEQAIAFLILLLHLDEIEILNVGVHPTVQRQGLASQLLKHGIEFAKAYSVKKIFLEVSESNLTAIKLYEKHHFRQVGLRKNYYTYSGKVENALLYSLEL